jgi:hypothetical protein
VEIRFAAAMARQGHGESDDGAVVEGSENLAAYALRNDKHTPRDYIAIAVTPDFVLENDAALKVFEPGKGLNVDCRLGVRVHDLGGSVAAFFA